MSTTSTSFPHLSGHTPFGEQSPFELHEPPALPPPMQNRGRSLAPLSMSAQPGLTVGSSPGPHAGMPGSPARRQVRSAPPGAGAAT